MSATTPAKRERPHHVILRHAQKPYGIFVIGALLFAAAWAIWTFVYASPIPH